MTKSPPRAGWLPGSAGVTSATSGTDSISRPKLSRPMLKTITGARPAAELQE
jgi:hypothetical protein